jgi:hypothetical protein
MAKLALIYGMRLLPTHFVAPASRRLFLGVRGEDLSE